MEQVYSLSQLSRLYRRINQPKMSVPDFLSYIRDINDDPAEIENILDPGSEADQLADFGGPDDEQEQMQEQDE